MANIKRANTSGLTKSGTAIPDVPDAPTIGTATDVGTSRAFNNASATVAITSAAATGGTPTSYTVTSSPGGFSASGTSPVTVTGLQSNTAYTFTARGVNATATGPASSASNSITATTVPATMTAPTATNVGTSRAYNNGAATVSFTAPATGGKTITGYTITSSPGSFTGTGASSPITVAGLQSATAYTFTATATNANGTSSASSASASITATTIPQAPTIGTATAGNAQATVTFTGNATGGSAITGYTVTSSPGSITGTGAGSPITVSGLTNGTAYTFTATATNANGTSAASAASNSVTPVVPTKFDSIASATTSGVTTVTFSSIPQTYKHLQIRVNYLNASGNTGIGIRINGLSTNIYLSGYEESNGSTATANTYTGNAFDRWGIQRAIGANTSPGAAIIDLLEYTNTNQKRTIRALSGNDTNNTTTGYVVLTHGYADTTAAISSIEVQALSGTNFSSGISIALYGIGV